MLLHHKTIKIKGRVVVCSIPWLCIVKMAKNGFFHEAGKKGRSNVNPNKLFFYSNDLNTMAFKSRDIFITFEMQGSSYKRPVGKINILLLFYPLTSEVHLIDTPF